MKELFIYHSVRIFGVFIRCLSLPVALWVGRFVGSMAYYFDVKHRSQAYANLKMSFSESKSSDEIKQITKQLFKNYGQNLIELFRMPLLSPQKFEELVKIDGKEHVIESLKKGKGCILLAMHFGSWEMASLSCAMLGHPYKVIVKPQNKYTRLDNLLNSYRACGGSVVLSRGMGTRDFIKSLKNNEVIGMVVDQGGRDGVLVPFFGRQASMSVGAIRMGLKLGVPLCFSIIIRENGAQHRMIFHEPLELDDTGNLDQDLVTNLNKITDFMEHYIQKYPSEYMWFYKIWKYSKEANVALLSDGKMGHQRQSEAVATMTQKALAERGITSQVNTVRITFKNKFLARIFSGISFFAHPFVVQGRLEFLKWFLTKSSFAEVMSIKADFIISCGSSIAGLNHLLSQDYNAKSIGILKPGLLNPKKFDLLILPRHDMRGEKDENPRLAVTHGAPNLITDEYLEKQGELLLNRYSHLKGKARAKIGLLIGGDAKHVFISEHQIKILIHQIKEVAQTLKADILVTTSRRTPKRIEQLLSKQLKKEPYCPLFICARRENVPEAIGGMLSLSDILVVSGDSISMISEAASSGKKTIVFSPQYRAKFLKTSNKHQLFVKALDKQGFIVSPDLKNVGRTIYDMAKQKIQTRRLDDNEIIFEAVKNVI